MIKGFSEKQTDFVEAFAKVTAELKFSVLLYDLSSDAMVSIDRGNINDMAVPESMRQYLNDSDIYCTYLSHGDEVMVLYFLRFSINGYKYILVINDNKKHSKINSFASALIKNIPYGSVIGSPDLENKPVSMVQSEEDKELVKMLEANIEELKSKIDAHEQSASLDKAMWEQEKSELKKVISNLGVKSFSDSTDDTEVDNSKVKMLQAHLDMAKIELNDKESLLNDLKAKLEELNSQKVSLQKEHSEALKDLQDKLKNVDKERAKLEAELLEKDAEVRMLESAAPKALEKAKDDQEFALQTIDKLHAELKNFDQKCQNLQIKADQLTAEVEEHKYTIKLKDKTIEKYVKSVEQQRSRTKEKDLLAKELEDKVEQLSSKINVIEPQLAELEALGDSRDKLRDMINAVISPLVTINDNFYIVTANKTAASFCRTSDAEGVMGRRCHDALYNNESKCEWCMLEKVIETRESQNVSVFMGEGDGKRCYNVTFSPIFNLNGQVMEVAEYISDATEAYSLNNAIEEYKEKISDAKVQQEKTLKDIEDLKRIYKNVKKDHEATVDKNNKMLKVIEKLVSEDKARELLKTRTELMDVKHRLARSTEMIKNYKTQLDEQLNRYNELNRRTFMQMERLLNIIKMKANFNVDEVSGVLNFLTKEFDQVKSNFVEVDRSFNYDFENLTESKYVSEEEKKLAKRLGKDRLFDDFGD